MKMIGSFRPSSRIFMNRFVFQDFSGFGFRPFSAPAALTPEQRKAEALKGFPKPRIIPKKTLRRKHNPGPHVRQAHPWLFIGHQPTKKYTPRQPWSLSSEEYYAIKNDRTPIKVPLADRLPSPKHLIRTLKLEEIEKTKVAYPRDVQPFRSGDRIKITKYISLGRETKFEILKGMCLGIKRNNFDTTFKIINHRDGLSWEMTLPLWSPFIKKIEVLQKSKYTNRSKLYFMRQRHPDEFMTK
eukprot:CAMPEP_0175163738 /NCGR_PEP_ID=MMETSP0087-20121206/25951_1 /TAXON_ID=136419 /ORGANISM="Unknown Unknown, Strain D1" /LENGTH=240 /DNA_ID=CAMNT_0016452545 /DNA_START=31 /DNA_END=753 /DNA_ORIENTATION=-